MQAMSLWWKEAKAASHKAHSADGRFLNLWKYLPNEPCLVRPCVTQNVYEIKSPTSLMTFITVISPVLPELDSKFSRREGRSSRLVNGVPGLVKGFQSCTWWLSSLVNPTDLLIALNALSDWLIIWVTWLHWLIDSEWFDWPAELIN